MTTETFNKDDWHSIDQPAAPALTIATKKGRIRCSSLRPGDYLLAEDARYASVYLLVLINSAKLQRMVVSFCDGCGEDSAPYNAVVRCGWTFVGHGQRRAWWKFLPKWLQRRICEWKLPT
jgi:hypothetical protein